MSVDPIEVMERPYSGLYGKIVAFCECDDEIVATVIWENGSISSRKLTSLEVVDKRFLEEAEL